MLCAAYCFDFQCCIMFSEGVWTLLRDVDQPKVECEHLNTGSVGIEPSEYIFHRSDLVRIVIYRLPSTHQLLANAHSRGAEPTYNQVFQTLAECQAACSENVPECNTINYAPADVPDMCVPSQTCKEDLIVFREKYTRDTGDCQGARVEFDELAVTPFCLIYVHAYVQWDREGQMPISKVRPWS